MRYVTKDLKNLCLKVIIYYLKYIDIEYYYKP